MGERVASPIFVGRGRELAILRERYSKAVAGEPQFVLIGGEAGIGKTRLVAEFLGEVSVNRIRTCVGGCPPQIAGGLPFAAVSEALRHFEGVDALVPDITRAGPAGGEQNPDRLAPSGALRVFEQLLDLLERLSADQPLVLVLEDLQWADPSTLDLLSFLARTLRAGPVLIIGTYRTDVAESQNALRSTVAELERHTRVRKVLLSRLDRDETAAQLAAIVGGAPPPDLVASIHGRAEGNPFFTEELLAAEADHPGTLPTSVADMLAVRMSMLPDHALAIVRIAAVVGRRLSHDMLAGVSQMPNPALSDGVRAAIGGSILMLAGDHAADAYQFRHALLREAVLRDILPGERRSIHAAIARILVDRPSLAGASRVEQAVTLAVHWKGAGDAVKARPAFLEAAAAAEEVYGFAEADAFYEQAFRLPAATPAPGNSSSIGFRPPAMQSQGSELVELYRHAAETASLAGAPARAIDRIREAIRLAPPRGPSAALLRDRLARYLWDAGQPTQSLSAYDDALGALGDARGPERARILAGRARVLMLAGRYADSAEAAAEAASVAREAGDRREEWQATNMLGTDLAFMGRMAEARSAMARAQSLDPLAGQGAPRPSRIIEHIGAALSEAAVLERSGLLEESAEASLRGVDLARHLGVDRTLGGLTVAVAARELLQLGRWKEATALIETALAEGVPSPIRDLELHTTQARLAITQGRLDEGMAFLRAASRAASGAVPERMVARFHAAAAELALWQRDPVSARAAVADGLVRLTGSEDPIATIELSCLGVRVEADAAEAARDRRALGEGTHAAERASELLALALVSEGRGDGGSATAHGHVILGQAELSRARVEPDPRAWEAAARAWADLKEPYREAYASWRWAEAILNTHGPRNEAEPILAGSRRIGLELEAQPLLAEIEALARRARLELPPVSPEDPAAEAAVRTTAPDLGLSEREMEVLLLLAEGRTNRQIAETLFITEKTAGHHVSNILGKLGVSNRLEAAAVAHRAGIGSDAAH